HDVPRRRERGHADQRHLEMIQAAPGSSADKDCVMKVLLGLAAQSPNGTHGANPALAYSARSADPQPPYAAAQRSAAASASARFTPAATFASRHRSPLSDTNSLPSAEASQAGPCFGPKACPFDRYLARPSNPRSQPMPTAPGPNSAQILSSTCAMCSSSSRARPFGCGFSLTSIQLVLPPYSHVASK